MTAVVPPCGEAPGLAAGVAASGTLGPGAPRRGAAFIEHHTVWPDDSTRVRIQMTSAAFEPFLLLFDDTGQVIGQAFAATVGGGHLAVLEAVLAGRCHTVGASTWSPDARGDYTLRLDDVGP